MGCLALEIYEFSVNPIINSKYLLDDSVFGELRILLENIQKLADPGELGKVDISRPELLALMHIDETYDGMNMSTLARNLSMPLSTASGVVDRLEKKKLLLRKHGTKEDKRIVTVHLTDEGKWLIKQYRNQVSRILDEMSSILTEEEFQMAIILFRKVARGLRAKEK